MSNVCTTSARNPYLHSHSCIQQHVAFSRYFFRFRNGEKAHDYLLSLPLYINKFFEPTDMTSEQFFARWKQLSQ
jgi:AP-2 complex subunit alpha